MNHGRRRLLMQLPLLAAARVAVGARRSLSLEERLAGAIEGIELVDTHEHIIPEPERVAQEVDFFTLASHYAISDVVSAGLPSESLKLINKPDAPVADKWRAFDPFWKYSRFTGYSQALRIAIRDVYGFEISASTLPKINEAIRARNKPGLYRDILRGRARIRFSVLDDYWNAKAVRPDPQFFVLARKFDRYVTPASPADIQLLEQITDVAVTSLDGLNTLPKRAFNRACRQAWSQSRPHWPTNGNYYFTKSQKAMPNGISRA